MPGVIVREPADSPAAVALVRELDAHLEPLYPSASRHGFSVDRLLADGVDFFVLRDAGAPAGCAGLLLVGQAYAEVKRMYVRPALRGRGFAQQLLAHLEAYAQSNNIFTLRLETGIYQHEALRLYERAGFRPIGPFGPYQADPLSVCYEKLLA